MLEAPRKMAIDNHGVLKSGILVALSRGRRKIGYRATAGIANEGSYLFTRERYPPLPIARHALERYLDLVRQLGVPTEGVSLEYPVSSDAVESVRRVLDSRGFGARPLTVIHPLAKWDTKQWAPEKFSELADRLAEKGGRVVFTGSPGDAEAVDRIYLGRIRSPSRVLNLAGQTDLRRLAARFSLADLVITNNGRIAIYQNTVDMTPAYSNLNVSGNGTNAIVSPSSSLNRNAKLSVVRMVGQANPLQIEKFGSKLFKAIRSGRIAQPVVGTRSKRLNDLTLARLDKLKEWRKKEAAAMRVESDIILPKPMLYAIAEQGPRDMDKLGRLMSESPWRYRHYGESILKTLESKGKPKPTPASS